MVSFIGNIVKSNTDISDDVIMTNMLAASKGMANAYFATAMASTTPELKAMLSSNLTQVMNGYAALTELAIRKGWVKPYDTPVQQLADVYNESVFAEKQ